MEKYSDLVIELYKNQFSDYVNGSPVNADRIFEVQTCLNKAIDKATILQYFFCLYPKAILQRHILHCLPPGHPFFPFALIEPPICQFLYLIFLSLFPGK